MGRIGRSQGGELNALAAGLLMELGHRFFERPDGVERDLLDGDVSAIEAGEVEDVLNHLFQVHGAPLDFLERFFGGVGRRF